ncbi:hypothetical protein MHUMG1_00040 [Metarhizium humberi]|uniref:Uncharacterized protein n=1 Tax=Metarhizium humberi TaxID=2596975 RepID=A0A9P8MIV1_9HYPO|nr:hypothetical protein MHUMG1_00040 [Metarhizium humberi]
MRRVASAPGANQAVNVSDIRSELHTRCHGRVDAWQQSAPLFRQEMHHPSQSRGERIAKPNGPVTDTTRSGPAPPEPRHGDVDNSARSTQWARPRTERDSLASRTVTWRAPERASITMSSFMQASPPAARVVFFSLAKAALWICCWLHQHGDSVARQHTAVCDQALSWKQTKTARAASHSKLRLGWGTWNMEARAGVTTPINMDNGPSLALRHDGRSSDGVWPVTCAISGRGARPARAIVT